MVVGSGIKEVDGKRYLGATRDITVPYIPITQKTPSRHPVYSMIPPTLAGMTAMYRTGEQDAQ